MPGFYILMRGNSRAEMAFIPRKSGSDHVTFFKGEALLPAPVYFRKHLGAVLYDHVSGGDPYLQLYHQRFFNELLLLGYTGFMAVPAILQARTTTTDHACLVVTGRAGEEDVRKGEIIDLGPIVPGGPSKIVKRGIFFDEDTWDGSDFFLLKDKTFVIVTERVKEVIERLQLTNVKVVPVEEVEVSIFNLCLKNPELREYYMAQLR